MKHRILSLLVLLLTAASGAWAETINLSTLTDDLTAQDGDVLTGKTMTSLTVTIADGATVTLDGVEIFNYDYHSCIKCNGNATIILKDGTTNILITNSYDYPALWVGDAGTTLTIQGSTGVLYVESGPNCAGIGGGDENTNNTCGNITIEGGLITAQGGDGGAGIGSDAGTATCGNITITGGTVWAMGGRYAAGIGCGIANNKDTQCGNITIAKTVTSVTAKKGENAPYSIGKGYTYNASATCGTVTICGTEYANGVSISPFNTATDVVVIPTGNNNEWEFNMPAYDMVLTPMYSEATVRRTVGQTTSETAYESLKEAFATVKNGDVIVLDWNVELTDYLETPEIQDGVKFTLDLNGFTITSPADNSLCILLINKGDEMTITDSSTRQTGGIKGYPKANNEGSVIFDGGRYFFDHDENDLNAEYLTDNWAVYAEWLGWQMADGKKFVNLNNGQVDDDGFMVRVDYEAFELTIGAGRFATFYDTRNITMIEENQNISFYTIKRGDIDLANNVAKVTKVENDIIPAGLPLLVYNGGQQQQTVKLKVTTTEATPIPNIAIEFVGTASGREFYDEDMAAYDYYALSGGKMFVPVYETGNIAPHKCWIQFPKQQGGARSITIVFDDATAISTVSGSPADTGDIYDLNGRKIVRGTSSNGTLRKGVYVKEGQKVIIK